MQLAAEYTEARGRFLDAARDARARLTEHRHPLTGPAGEVLATDVAVIGRPDAPTRMLVISGTHGVEGFAGSLCQTAWLEQGATVPDDLAVVMIHAINPYGFAWIRRVNEDNVDLNRNCIDFGTPPENSGYDQLADVLVPRVWDDATQAQTAEALLEFAAEHGFDGLQAAVSMGQYRHPTGIFYGGARPVWSQRTLETIAKATLAGAERTGIVDLHTGLGPFGVGELIASHPDDAGRARLDAWYGGDYTLPSEGTSVSADVRGDVLDALDDWVECPEITSVAIEWGTVDIVEVSNALRGDAWLHAHADPRGPEAGPIKAALRAAFAPDDPQWADLVWERFTEVAGEDTEGLRA